MFVRNDARFDSRVRREAATLTGAGHQVTLVTLAPIRGAPADLPWHDGSFEVVRVRQRRVWLRAFRRSVPDRGRAAGKGPASGLRWLVEWHESDSTAGRSLPGGARRHPMSTTATTWTACAPRSRRAVPTAVARWSTTAMT